MTELLKRDLSASTATEYGHAILQEDPSTTPESFIKLRVQGMRCSNCAKGVETALLSISDVQRVNVQVVSGFVEAQVSHATSEKLTAQITAITDALRQKNYQVDLLDVVPISATSPLCHLDLTLVCDPPSIPGVHSVIKLSSRNFRFTYDPYITGARKIFSKNEGATLSRNILRMHALSYSYLIDLGLATFLTLALHWEFSGFFLFLGVAVAYGFCGRRFLLSAAKQIFSKSGNFGMEVLVSVGMTGALVGGLLTNDEDERSEFFSMTALLVAVVLIGKFLEDFAKRRASRFLGVLDHEWQSPFEVLGPSAPQGGQLGFTNGEQVTMYPITLLELGDRVRLKSGDKIPCDGVIEWQSGAEVGAIESLITGEDVVVKKTVGQEVLAGSLLVGGSVVIKVKRIGEMTVIKQIENLAIKAQSTRLDTEQKLVDKVSGVFVPLVIVIAVLTYVIWRFVVGENNKEALNYALAVLMVSCPCALGLAAPTAIVMATSVAAKTLGAIVKSIHVLENLAKVRVVVFDKTSTLTCGKPAVTAVERELAPTVWAAIAALEGASEHPIGRTIGEFAETKVVNQGKQISDFKIEAAVGVSGVFNGVLVQIRGDAETPWLVEQRSSGRVAVGVFVDGNYEGGLALRDPPRHDAQRVVKMLKHRGIDVVMCTGDSEITAKAIAKEVGIEVIYAKCTPQDKQRVVGEIKANKNFVVMVGDGINDAPALASATVGVAMGSGVRIASESADVVLVRTDSLANLVGLIDLSKSTLKCIKRNLLWAFGFNSIMIPWAAGLFHFLGLARIPPALAGVAMAGSSLLVVFSSLLLGRFRAPASDCE